MPPKIDMTGYRFGRLVVKKESNHKSWGRICWVCKCDCGSVHVVDGGSLRRGEVVSCGCYHRECVGNLARGKRMPKSTKKRISDALSGRKRIYLDGKHWIMPERGVTLSDVAKQQGVSLSELRSSLLKARKKNYASKVKRSAPYGRAGRGGRMAI